MWRGTISPRRIAALACELPPGARVHRETDAEWIITDHLLTSLIEVMSGTEAPLPRPGDQRRARLKAERAAEKARRHELRKRQREAAAAAATTT